MASFRRSSESDRVFAMPLLAHIALLLALTVVLAFVLGFGLWWGIGRPSMASGGRWTAKEGFDFIKIVLALVGGTGAVVALVVSYRKQRIGEAAETREDARLFGEDFARASEQLGSAEAPVRLAGMYTLERLGQNTPAQRQTIVNVLCAYLRMPYSPPETEPSEEHRDENERRKHEREVRLTAQRILAENICGRKDSRNPGSVPWKGVNLDLTGAVLSEFNLSGCQLDRAIFTGAQFSRGALFKGVQFSGTVSFERAEFSGGALFGGAQFSRGAWFDDAQFSGITSFGLARFSKDASFCGVQFSSVAAFENAQFGEDALFDGSQFSGVTLFTNAQFGGITSFDGAQFNKDVTFDGSQFNGVTSFGEAKFNRIASPDGTQATESIPTWARIDVPDSVSSNRVWPEGYVLIDPVNLDVPLFHNLPESGRWGYLVRVDTEQTG